MKVRWLCLATAIAALTVAVIVVKPSGAKAELTADQRTRCAVRLSIGLLGQSPDAALLEAANPQDQVDALLTQPEFVQRFARFINASFNPDPGANAAEDATFFLARHILQNDLPWRDMFLGRFNVGVPEGGGGVQVTEDPDGLGYFRSRAWLVRYAGNEEEGYKLVTAYRILQNVIGLELVASTNAPDADISATGRMAQPCASCHYEGPFALDLVARVLTRRQGQNNNITFLPPTDGPQMLLDGQLIANDEELVTALVNSDTFRFRTCRLAFQYVYGRPERACEGEIFDRCMAEFERTGRIQSAVAVVAKDPGFCQ